MAPLKRDPKNGLKENIDTSVDEFFLSEDPLEDLDNVELEDKLNMLIDKDLSDLEEILGADESSTDDY